METQGGGIAGMHKSGAQAGAGMVGRHRRPGAAGGGGRALKGRDIPSGSGVNSDRPGPNSLAGTVGCAGGAD